MMSTPESMLERNKDFAARQSAAGTLMPSLPRALPNVKAVTRLAGDPAMLTRYFQVEERELKAKAVTNPRAAVAVDVGLLRQIPGLPGEWLISGLVYDVATGLVEIVVPPSRIRTA